MERFSPFPKVNSSRGAPMGRFGADIDPDTPFESLCVAGPAYEYDCGGAYWGLGSAPVWAVWMRGKGREGVSYVRATCFRLGGCKLGTMMRLGSSTGSGSSASHPIGSSGANTGAIVRPHPRQTLSSGLQLGTSVTWLTMPLSTRTIIG